jgi:hypothetical protein
MNKETQSIADKLLKKGQKVFVNEAGELFTQENLAKVSGSSYKEYHNPKFSMVDENKSGAGSPASEIQKKNYSQENNETLIKTIEERGLELGEAKVKKDFVAILEADDLKKSEANPTGGDDNIDED